MKKSLFFVATAALVLASCSNDVKISENVALEGSNAQKEISFFPLSSLAKRVIGRAPVSSTTFPTDYNFFISAYAVDAAGDYFGKAEYTREGVSGNTWSGVSGSKQYWPLSPETLNFLAVTKSDADGDNTTFGTADANYASKVVVDLGDNRTAQHDLMYSYARAAVTKGAGNALIFNGGSNVGMEFFHTQAWVNFTVKAANSATAGAGLVVTNIQLKQAVYNGTATVTLANYNSKTESLTPSLAWDGTAYGTATKYDVDVPGITNVAVNSTSEIAAGTGLMIVPNPTKTEEVLNPSFTTFVVSYTLNGKAYTFEYTPTAAQKQMEPAHKYNFNITFTLHEIKVDATVDEWTPSSENINIPA